MFCIAKQSKVMCLFCLSCFRSFFSFPFFPSLCLFPLYTVLFLPYPTIFVFNLTSLWYKTGSTYFSQHLTSSNLSSIFFVVFFCTFYFQLSFAALFIFNLFLLFCIQCFNTFHFFLTWRIFFIPSCHSSIISLCSPALLYILIPCYLFSCLSPCLHTCPKPEGSGLLFFGSLCTQRKTIAGCQQVWNQYLFWLSCCPRLLYQWTAQ